MDSSAAAQRADAIEAAAFADLYAAAPAALQQRLRLQVRREAGATLLIAPGLPSTMFNRVIGLGNASPASAADVQALRAAYRDAGAASWWLHWTPAVAQPPDFPARLEALGFRLPARRSWAKVMRGCTAPPSKSTARASRSSFPRSRAIRGGTIPGRSASWSETRSHWS